MNRESYVSEAAGRLVRTGPRGVPYWALVPNPLPPAMVPDLKVTRVLANAAYALGELAALGSAS